MPAHRSWRARRSLPTARSLTRSRRACRCESCRSTTTATLLRWSRSADSCSRRTRAGTRGDAALEESMNARAQELAREKKLADRAFLDQKPEGVPLRELPLDDDSDFVAMEQERRQLLEKDPRRNAREIAALEESMNARAQELAREKKLADRAFLDQKPEGVRCESCRSTTTATLLRWSRSADSCSRRTRAGTRGDCCA
ncbi:putative calpain cysteine peptidase [Trypanosoma cruzi]|uniref:Putative calpain cysteine peptidase n=1 Tax=Trypanosoma cruzi TaxID=5693 RepID=A0A2V2VPR1_TRYCR|nr:putative calpain cysteine peptidase [Trypanosoma cruzi]